MGEGVLQLVAIFLIHLILSSVSGICFFIVGFATTRTLPAPIKPGVVALAFTLAETMRSLGISSLFYGENTTIDLHFTASTLGNALSITPFVEFAYLGGTFALTFVLVYVIYCVHSLHGKKAAVHFLIIFLLYLGIHIGVPINRPSQDIRLSVITTDIPTSDEEMLQKHFKETNTHILATLLSSQEKPDIVVLPEDARFFSTISKKEGEAIKRVYAKTFFVDGETLQVEGRLVNASLFFDFSHNTGGWRGKSLLLPFNEYIPYAFLPFFKHFLTTSLEDYTARHTYLPVTSKKTFSFKGETIGSLICSETLSFATLQELKKEKPSFVVYQARLNVFNNNPLFVMHMRSFNKIAAAQLRTPFVTSANAVPSYMINAHGQIVGVIQKGTHHQNIIIKKTGEILLY